ncbi:MAG: alpha-2-macroglobulin family protein [Polyangiaceae bacterium]
MGGRWLGLLLCVASACAGRPASTPALPVERARPVAAPSRPEAEPFQVVYAGTNSKYGAPDEVVLAFSRPVTAEALAALRVVEASSGLPTLGAWDLLGDRLASFSAESGFAAATDYRVEFSSGLRARDGAPLLTPASFVFSIPPVSVRSAQYSFDADEGPVVDVELNQQIRQGALADVLVVEGRGARGVEAVPFRVQGRFIEDDDEMFDNAFRLLLDRRAPRLEQVSLATRGSHSAPLVIDGIGPLRATFECKPPGAREPAQGASLCSLEEGAVSLEFNKEVSQKALMAALSGAPLNPGRYQAEDVSLNSLDLSELLKLEPSHSYRSGLSSGLSSFDAASLAGPRGFAFRTSALAASNVWRGLRRVTVYEAARSAIPFGLESVNWPSIELVQARLDVPALLELLAKKATRGDLQAIPGAISTRLGLSAPDNQRRLRPLSLLEPLRGAGRPGVFAVASSGLGPDDEVRFLSATDLAITAKWSPFGGLAWVTRISTAEPEAGVQVSLMQRGKSVFSGRTDAQGVVLLPESASAAALRHDLDSVVLAQAGDDLAFLELKSPDGWAAAPRGALFTDRELYRAGAEVRLKGVFRVPTRDGLGTPRGEPVRIELRDLNQHPLAEYGAVLDDYGAFAQSLRLPREVRLGRVELRAHLLAHGARYGARSVYVNVQEFRAPEMKLPQRVALDAGVAPADAAQRPPGEPPTVPAPLERCRSRDGSLVFTAEGGARHDVGGELRACVASATPVLLTLEGNRVLSYQVRSGAQPLELGLPLGENLLWGGQLVAQSPTRRRGPIPAAHVVHDRGAPDMRTSEQDVRLKTPRHQELALQLTLPKDPSPGEDATIGVAVKDGNGKPVQSQLTLWALDEDDYQLAPFSAPDLRAQLFEERGSAVQSHSSLDHIFSGLAAPMRPPRTFAFGAAFDGRGGGIYYAEPHPAAFFAASLDSSPDGSLRFPIHFPDDFSGWKVFATAITQGEAFGRVEGSLRARQSLLVQPISPRFLRVGDRFEAALALSSAAPRALELDVSLVGTGSVRAVGTKHVRLADNASSVVRFQAEALGAGAGSLRFRVGSAGSLGSVSRSRPIRVSEPTPLEPKVRGGLSDAFDAMFEPAYPCTEQLASRLLPQRRLKSLAQAALVASPENVAEQQRDAVANLLSHQTKDGGFGFWSGYDKSEPAVSAWVLFALATTRTGGEPIPEEPIVRLVSYLEAAGDDDSLVRTLLEWALSGAGRPRGQQLRALALADERPKTRLERALLAQALARLDKPLALSLLHGLLVEGVSSGSSRTLAADPSQSLQLAFLTSDTVTTAAALSAVVALDPTPESVLPLVNGLFALRRGSRWATTQDNAWALLALDESRAFWAASGVPAPTPNTVRQQGIHVARQWSKPRNAIQLGNTLNVSLFLVSPIARRRVALDAPIPAGFEVVASAYTAIASELHDDRVRFFFDELAPGVTQVGYTLRALVAGTFAEPPARAECMYQPELFGSTADDIATVLPPAQ